MISKGQASSRGKTSVLPVCLFWGPEELLMDEEIRRRLDLTLSSKEKGLNFHLFRGGEHTGEEILQTARTLPMFSRYRFVLVRDADRIDPKKMEPFLRYLQNPCPSTCLVLAAQTLGPWKKHRKQIEAIGKAVEYSRLKGRALDSWLKRRMTEKGKRLSDEAVDYLLQAVGDDLHQLENALEKAFLTVGDKGTVDLSDVEGVVADVKVSTVFELTDAIGNRDLQKAFGILQKVMDAKAILFRKDEETSKTGDPVPLLLGMMARQYRMIWRVKELLGKKKGMEEIAGELRMTPWTLRNLVGQSGRFVEADLREGLARCHETDLAIKRGRGPKGLLMEKLVIDLCHPPKP